MLQGIDLCKKYLLSYFFLAIILNYNIVNCQNPTATVELGQIIEFKSQVLNENRNVFIYTPVGYENSNQKYPTLYLTDAEGNYFLATAVVDFLSRTQSIPPMVVVGIPNVDRNRDLSPSIIERNSDDGGGENFLKFFEDELVPYIEDKYKVNNYKIFFGHSLGGMFAIYALTAHPELFNSFIAASPYLMYDDEYVIRNAESGYKNLSNYERQLFITLGDEPAYVKSLNKFTQSLKENANNLRWEYKIFQKEDHNTIPLYSISEGLKFIFSDFQLTNEIIMQGLNAIIDHYQVLELKYDLKLKIPEFTLNAVGYRFLQREEFKKAIEVFEHNIKLYPNSANVYDSLGDALERSGQLILAAQNYKRAVTLGEKNNDPNLNIFRKNFERLNK